LKQTCPKKLSAGIVLGTPPGGEIILGRLDGIPMAVALGETPELGVGSMMMLGPMTKLDALSEPVGFWDCTAGGGVGVASTELGDSTGVGDPRGVDTGVEGAAVAEMASVIEPGRLLGASDAGTLEDSGAGVGVTMGETPVPVPEEGRMPEGVGIGDSLTSDGVIPDGVGTSVSLGVGIPLALGVSDGVGTEPEGGSTLSEGEGKMPDGVGTTSVAEGSTPLEEISDRMLDTMLLAGGTGMTPVGVGSSDNRLETMLGTTEPGISGTADSKMLETSETSDETIGGRMPAEGVGAGVGEGDAGSVAPAEPEGIIPGISDSIDERPSGSEGTTTSDVGIAGVGDAAPVPSAVVMPTTMPPEDG